MGRKPVKNNIDKLSIAEVQARIFKIIPTLSASQMRILLKGLEKWEPPQPIHKQNEKFDEKRAYPRKHASVYAICETKNANFRNFTKNVSAGGVFIETDKTLSIDDDLFMTLVHSSFETPIRSNGKIAWVDSNGAGVKFDKTISRMSIV